MFETIFKTDAKVALHLGAPYARQRARYLSECAQRGYKLHTVHIKANELLWIAHRLKCANVGLRLTKAQVEFALRDGNRRARNRRCRSGTPPGGRSMIGPACAWLRFLGFLQPVLIPFHQKLNACRWAREERGFSEQTITTNHGCIKGFLSWYSRRRRPLSAVRINDIDVYLAHGAKRGGWSRHYVCDVAKVKQGYPSETIRRFLLLVADFIRWLKAQPLTVKHVTHATAERYLRYRLHHRRRRKGNAPALRKFVQMLQHHGVVELEAHVSQTVVERLISDYSSYLHQERGLAATTVRKYVRAARSFVIHPFNIALWMGHESVQTTQIYLDANLELKEKVLAKVRPHNSKVGRYRPGSKLTAFLASL